MIILSRKQLSEKYDINNHTWTRRHDDLIDYLQDYLDIEEYKEKGSYFYKINEDEMPDYIPPIPRKSWKKEVEDNYDNYVKEHLPIEFTPLSKSRMSKDAIDDFGYDKYGHTSIKYITRRYVSESMDKYGEYTEERVWVRYDTYEELDENESSELMDIFRRNNMSNEEMVCAWIKQEQGEDVSKEKKRFKDAMNEFKKKYHTIPVYVPKWKLKEKEAE